LFFVSHAYQNFKQDCCYYFSFSADRADEIVERFISLGDTSGSEPTGYGFSAFGEDYSCNYGSQSPCRALMQDAGKSYYPDLPVVRENPFIKHRLSFPNMFCSNKHIGRVSLFILIIVCQRTF